MQKLKSVWKQVTKSDLLDVCSRAATLQQLQECIRSYQSLPPSKQQSFNTNLTQKLKGKNNDAHNLNLLVMVDLLTNTCEFPIIRFPETLLEGYMQNCKAVAKTKEEKLKLAENTFICFYLQYLRIKIWGRCGRVKTIDLANLPESLAYAESAVEGLKLVLQHDFVLDYAAQNSSFKNQIKVAIENVLRRSQDDMIFLISMINKWSHAILEQQNLSVHINEVYEQLIYISRNVIKLQRVNSKIKGNYTFQKYEINKSLNKSIEQCMLGKETERRELQSQRKIKTLEDMSSENCEKQMFQITEQQIKVKLPI